MVTDKNGLSKTQRKMNGNSNQISVIHSLEVWTCTTDVKLPAKTLADKITIRPFNELIKGFGSIAMI